MRQMIEGNRTVLKYRWRKRPSMLRHRAKNFLPSFYGPTLLTTTDSRSGLTVIYHKQRDLGCFEITHVSGVFGDNIFPAYKKFYIGFESWKNRDPGEIEVMAMCLDSNCQTLYVLLKQKMVTTPYVGVWLGRINIWSAQATVAVDPPGVPIFDFIQPELDGHYVITTLSSRFEFLLEKGWHGSISAVPYTDNLYSVWCVQGKVFVTVPIIFDGPHYKDDYRAWMNLSNPCLIQAVFMVDGRCGILEGSGILSAVPQHDEFTHSPNPQSWPEHPLKVDVQIIDDCITWTLSNLHELPHEWYYEHCMYTYKNSWPAVAQYAANRRALLPFVVNRPNAWVVSNLPDRFYTFYRREAVRIGSFIKEFPKNNKQPLKPILCKQHNQFYIQHPPAFDLVSRSAYDVLGKTMLAVENRGITEYALGYHNFHRKCVRAFTNGPVPTYEVTDHEIGDFIYDGAGYTLDKDGVTKYYHIFGLENLSSNTYMINVKLTAPSSSSLRFGTMSGSPTMPTMTSITWPEIAPHTEALFTVYASEELNSNEVGTGLEYGLEIR